MSMAICCECGFFFDTDYDCDFGANDNHEIICSICMEYKENDQ